jgi:hypothetical protein
MSIIEHLRDARLIQFVVARSLAISEGLSYDISQLSKQNCEGDLVTVSTSPLRILAAAVQLRFFLQRRLTMPLGTLSILALRLTSLLSSSTILAVAIVAAVASRGDPADAAFSVGS